MDRSGDALFGCLTGGTVDYSTGPFDLAAEFASRAPGGVRINEIAIGVNGALMGTVGVTVRPTSLVSSRITTGIGPTVANCWGPPGIRSTFTFGAAPAAPPEGVSQADPTLMVWAGTGGSRHTIVRPGLFIPNGHFLWMSCVTTAFIGRWHFWIAFDELASPQSA